MQPGTHLIFWGDLGAGVTSLLGQYHPSEVVGVHLTSIADPTVYDPESLTVEEKRYLDEAALWIADEGTYEHQQMTRPTTLSYGLSDSPVGRWAGRCNDSILIQII